MIILHKCNIKIFYKGDMLNNRNVRIAELMSSTDLPAVVRETIETYERNHPEKIWKKEAERIYSTGGESLYQFRGKFYKGIRPFISRKNSSGRELGEYGEETIYGVEEKCKSEFTLESIKSAIMKSRSQEHD